MLYLADVSYDASSQNLHLRLMAQQRSEHSWQVLEEPRELAFRQGDAPSLKGLALVELSEGDAAFELRDASPWVLEIVRNYLSTGVTADFLQQEAERAEQWRQALTLQSQELGRRTLELEARMGQIQELEEKIKQDGDKECG